MDWSRFFEEDKAESMEEAGLKLVVKKRKKVTFASEGLERIHHIQPIPSAWEQSSLDSDFSDEYLENKENIIELRKQVKIENKLDYYLALYPLGCPPIPPHLADCEKEILNQLAKDISGIRNKEIKRRFIYAFQNVKLSFMAASALGRKVFTN